ncbi:MAG: hypothetical protein NVV70_16875 [Cellulomonas sp.]|nr:hypothetical protein [Cellulomonas sp.]MCR6649720.1 hypothetical protein [Cellulomonas sp.]
MQDHIDDTWAPLNYVPDLSGSGRPTGSKSWVDDVDARRLTAYRVLHSYSNNTRRYWHPNALWAGKVENFDGMIRLNEGEASNWREYGDANLLVNTARALILGEDQSIEFPELEDGQEPGPTEQWLLDWAVRERFTQKLLQGEETTCGVGDGVYALGVNVGKKRPVLRVYDPGFYFPDTTTVVDGWVEDDFAPIVHIAWEEDDTQGVTWVVRHTWQMTPLEVPRAAPWGGDAQTWACLYRHVRYRVDAMLDNATVYSPEISRQSGTVVVQDWTDLLVDFIPVVHVPNTPDEWGKSILLSVGQILDDMQGTDTDLSGGAQTSGSPMLVTSAPVNGLTGRPGEQLGQATASWTDTSKNLVALTGYLEKLTERLAQNSRLSQALLGQVQPNEVPSGTALSLGFHPARQLMREARTVRDEKYPLILRFAMRLAQAAGWLPAGPTPAAVVTLGASLPADLAEAVATVKDLLPAHAISTQTAVRILVRAGLPIEDAAAEVDRIKQESYDAAVKLVEATGNAAAAAQMLGVPPVTTTGLAE